MGQEKSAQIRIATWVLFAVLAAWLPYFTVEGTTASVSIGLSGVASLMTIPAFRKPVWSNPWVLSNRDRSYGFSNGLFFAGTMSLLGGLIVDEPLGAGMGALFLWMAAVGRVTCIDADERAQLAEAAEAATDEAGAARRIR